MITNDQQYKRKSKNKIKKKEDLEHWPQMTLKKGIDSCVSQNVVNRLKILGVHFFYYYLIGLIFTTSAIKDFFIVLFSFLIYY